MAMEIVFPEFSKEQIKNAIWATDMHFDAVPKHQFLEWCQQAKETEADLLLIGGDICNGKHGLQLLKEMASIVEKPLYFVLGNHDFYYGSIHAIRSMADNLSKESPWIHYLPQAHIIELTPKTALIGHDGWADARAGDFHSSTVILNDYVLIDELKNRSKEELQKKLSELGEESARYLSSVLREAFQKYENVILLTHVPPYTDACYYKGEKTDKNWSPHFVNQKTGEVILDVFKDYPGRQLMILCGHSHSAADVYITPSLRVVAAESELGNPKIYAKIVIN